MPFCQKRDSRSLSEYNYKQARMNRYKTNQPAKYFGCLNRGETMGWIGWLTTPSLESDRSLAHWNGNTIFKTAAFLFYFVALLV